MNIKKLFAILLAAVMVLAVVACSKDEDTGSNGGLNNEVEELVYENFTYDVNGEGTYEITGYIYGGIEAQDVVIPSQINGRDVTGIGKDAFKAFKTVKSVSIPETVTYIGDYAFYDCDALTAITIPNTVTKIGTGAFQACDALAAVTLPAGLVELPEYAFYKCTALNNVTLPESLKSIGMGAFMECKALTSIVVPTGVTYLGDCAFYSCSSLVSATVLGTELGEKVVEGDKVTYKNIGASVFNGCASGFTVQVTDGSVFAEYAKDNGYLGGNGGNGGNGGTSNPADDPHWTPTV